MLSISSDAFKIILAIYCLIAIIIINKPLISSAWFIFFRSTFQIAAFKGILIFDIIPYFTIPICLLAISAMISLTKTSSFTPPKMFVFYILLVTLVAYFGILHLSTNTLSVFLDFLIKIATPIFIFITTSVGIKCRADIYTSLKLGSYCSIVPLCAGFLQFYFGGGYDYKSDLIIVGERINGTIIDPNSFGIYLSFVTFITISIILTRPAVINVLVLILLLICIILAKNRGTWIALSCAIPLTVLVFRQHLRLHYWIVCGVILFIAALPIAQSRFGDLNKLDKYGQSQDTFSERINHHLDLIQMSVENPFIGYGIGSSELPITQESGFIELAHNDFLRIAVDTGYISLIIYFCFLVSTYFWTLRYRHSTLWNIQFAAHCALVYMFMMSFVDNIIGDILNYSVFMYILAISSRAPFVVEMDRDFQIGTLRSIGAHPK